MVDGVEFSQYLIEHFLYLALRDAVFKLEAKRLITGDDWPLQQGLREFEQSFAAVFHLNLFIFFLLPW